METDAKGATGGASAVPAVPLVIGKEQAEKVFGQYVWERRSAVDRREATGLDTVETGPLLAESLAWIEVLRTRSSDEGWSASFGKPEFLIPAEKDQPGYPRSFVTVSRNFAGTDQQRAGAVHYFVQEAPGAEWKATALSWVNERPAVAGKAVVSNEVNRFVLRDKEIAAVGRDAAGAVTLSSTAGEDRKVCGRYAQYMSFTAPDGEPESEHFVPGALTTEVVKAYNVAFDHLELVRKRYAFEVTGTELPVMRLADGKSLVTCSFVRTDHWKGKNATFTYGTRNLGDVAALIGGGDKWWRDTVVRRSVTVTFEVAPQGPADVVGSNALVAPPLSAEGTPK
uniref:DUF8094 domain-containing protein n=1 Tax=Streptomyces sp. NBC_00049 TaxID=2903617 RepID=A0AAU2JNU4_9ACTN